MKTIAKTTQPSSCVTKKPKPFDHKTYDRAYYQKHKELLAQRRLGCYYQQKYGIDQCDVEEFKRNKHIYIKLQEAHADLDKALVCKILGISNAPQSNNCPNAPNAPKN